MTKQINFNEILPQNHNFYAIDNYTHTIVKQRKNNILTS